MLLKSLDRSPTAVFQYIIVSDSYYSSSWLFLDQPAGARGGLKSLLGEKKHFGT